MRGVRGEGKKVCKHQQGEGSELVCVKDELSEPIDLEKCKKCGSFEEVPAEKEVPKQKTMKFGKETICAYEGKEKLPKEKLDSKGNVLEPGAPRHFLARHGNAYKLIRVYRAKGIKHSLVRVIKPYIKSKPQEKAFFQKLRKLEIPGAS